MDAKNILIPLTYGPNHYWEFQDGSVAHVIDVGDPDYLVYYDVPGNVFWAMAVQPYFWDYPDDLIIQLTHVAGRSDAADDVAVRAGLRGARNWLPAQWVMYRAVSDLRDLARSLGIPIIVDNYETTKLVRRSDVRRAR